MDVLVEYVWSLKKDHRHQLISHHPSSIIVHTGTTMDDGGCTMRCGWLWLTVDDTRPPAHEAKLLGAHFFGLLRGKKGAPRVYPWPDLASASLYVRLFIKDTLTQ